MTDGVDGVMVAPRDSAALGDAIVTVLNDQDLQRRLSKAGRLRAANFDIRKAVRRIEEVYRGLLS